MGSPRIIVLLTISTVTFVAAQTNADIVSANRTLQEAKASYEGTGRPSFEEIEQRIVLATGARVQRMGDRLLLRLSTGRTIPLDNAPACRSLALDDETKCTKYRLLAHSTAARVFVVAKSGYEWTKYLLIDDSSGEITEVPAVPSISPTGKRTVVLIENDDAIGFGIQIWRREGSKFVQEWFGSPNYDRDYISYKLLNWTNEDRIDLRSEVGTIKKRFALRRGTRDWTVRQLGPAAKP